MFIALFNKIQKALKPLTYISVFTLCLFVLSSEFTFAADDALGVVMDIVGGVVYWIALGLGGLFVGIGGLALDMAIKMLVIDMGNIWASPFGEGIIIAWEMIRDLFNILFIFGFIFLGIKTILFADDSGTRRSLGYLIIAALLINFSLLISQVIIDFSNVAATQAYNLITIGVSDTSVEDATKPDSQGLTVAFMDVVGLTSFFETEEDNNIKGGNLIVYSLLMLIFFVMSGIIFMFGVYHIVYRFVALSIYMILSPVLFLGMILPNFKGYRDRWLRGLLKQSFFAPAFLFLMYVSLLSLQRLKTVFGLNDVPVGYSTIMQGKEMTPDGFMIFVFFAIGIGFLYASIKAGEMLGISGASGVTGFFNNTARAVRNGVQGFAYRNTAGRSGRLGVAAIDALDRTAENKAAGRMSRLGAMTARTIMGGEQGRKAMQRVADGGGGGLSLSDVEGLRESRTKRAQASNKEKADAQKLSDSIANGIAASQIAENLRTPEQREAIRNLERSVPKASDTQILDIAGTDEGRQSLLDVSDTLTASQTKALIESDKIAEEFKKDLKSKRLAKVLQKVTDNPGDATKAELEIIGPEELIKPEMAILLNEKQIDNLELNDSDKNAIKKSRKETLEAIVENNKPIKIVGKNGAVREIGIDTLLKGKPKEIASLPKDILVHKNFAPQIPIPALKLIATEHGDIVQKEIRMKLQMVADGRQDASPRAKALHEFLTTDRIGKDFGR